MGAGWYFFWFFLVSDEPKNHRCIRQAEIQYIETNRPKIQAQSGIPPYFLILKCPAVWTIMACDFANGWGLFVLLNDGPTFVDKVLNQDISSVCMMINFFFFLIRNSTVCHRDGSDQLFPTLLKYVNYEGSWCIESELLSKKIPTYYSPLVIFQKNNLSLICEFWLFFCFM